MGWAIVATVWACGDSHGAVVDAASPVDAIVILSDAGPAFCGDEICDPAGGSCVNGYYQIDGVSAECVERAVCGVRYRPEWADWIRACCTAANYVSGACMR